MDETEYEHYRQKALSLMTLAEETSQRMILVNSIEAVNVCVAGAQVYATLANAAAIKGANYEWK